MTMKLSRGLPGETPLDDISGLIPPDVRTMGALNQVEFENILEAIAKYLAAPPSRRLAPFTVAWMLKLHRDMLHRVWEWAGTIRKVEFNFGVLPGQIRVRLVELADDIAFWRVSKDAPDIIEQAVLIHYRAVCIHPFRGGNGRWSRLLAEIWLRQNGHAGIKWAERNTDEGKSPIRDEYIAALSEADRGDMAPLIELARKFVKS